MCREIESTRVGSTGTEAALAPQDVLFMSGDESLAVPAAPDIVLGDFADDEVGVAPDSPPALASQQADGDELPNGQAATTTLQGGAVLGATQHLPGIAFAQRDMGIKFCTPSAPAHPFYPEGVALAYLLSVMDGAQDAPQDALQSAPQNAPQNAPRNNAFQSSADHLITAGIGPGFVIDALDAPRLAGERVEDIQSYATVPVSADALQNGVFAPTTGVCVEMARRSDGGQRRWLLFTLRYHPPDMEARTSDRWTISGVTQEPLPQDVSGNETLEAPAPDGSAPESGRGVGAVQAGYCRQILGLD